MQEFSGRVAVITGGASGIGFALAERAAREGMKVVICDVEATALEKARASLAASGATVAAHRLDVSNEAEMEAVAAKVFAEFGAVHLLCNNAGVINRQKAAWEHTVADWRWLLEVNLWGVIYGIRAFVPRMVASGEEGHIVNTSSMAGLVTGSMGSAVYDATKHAVLSLTESLYRDLIVRQDKVSASVLCPGAVTTNIMEAERNRPGGPDSSDAPRRQSSAADPLSGIESFPPSRMADQVFEAVRENRFYVLAAQDVMYEWTKMGHDRMWEGRNPAVPHRLIAARDAGKPVV
ncbi:MAG: SDR family NAD(P)-dependent oxidoreductase [Dehalococcoidia bacterium]